MKFLTVVKNIPLLFWMWRKRIKQDTFEWWVKEYTSTKINESAIKPTEQQFFIGFIGCYGVGKTSAAKKIIERLPFVLISSDEGRRFLQQRGVPSGIVDEEKLMFLMGLKVMQELVRRRNNILLDADLRQSRFRKELQNFITAEGYKFLLLHVIAKDETVLGRISKRRIKEESEYLRENMECHVIYRKRIHESEPMPPIFFTIHNDADLGNLDEQIDRFVIKYKKTFGAGTD
ncbi:MAG: AAA family ATPase [Parcubacteria group bacterium]